MAIFIEQAVDHYTIDAIVDSLQQDTLFEDGKKTAGKTAKKNKHNQQAKANTNTVTAATEVLEQALRKHPILRAAAIPKTFAKIIISRYTHGMEYGPHVDNAFIANVRTDLSFTLFLTEPDTYSGGELIIQRDDGDESVKLPKGSLYLYPSNSIHYVAPVTSGTRLAAVGWIQSRIKLDEHRQILFDLSASLNQLKDTAENGPSRLKILKVKNNLMRLWAE